MIGSRSRFVASWGLVAMLAAQAAPAAMVPLAGDPVSIDSGRVAGTQLGSGVRAYLGIPFAQPPVGGGRWAAPKAIAWEGVFNADRKGAECIQVLRPHNINHYFGEEPSSENCLYLNLWAPATATPAAKLPVIVFIYGGGYTIGSSGMANYDGENAAKAGAIFVNFNYRVGAFGFLAHRELSREQGGHSGNYGLLDQIAALKWVKANIAKFGGDPGKVLIIGQSAGAGSVIAHLFSPQSAGLFRAAVMSSGCNFSRDEGGLAPAEQIGLQMQKAIGARSLAEMRDVPADKILAAQTETQVGAHVEGVRVGGPIVDGYVLPMPKSQALAQHRINPAPIIASYNGDDIDQGQNPFGKARTVADYQRIATEYYGADAAAFLKQFPVKSDADVVRMSRQVGSMNGLEQSARQCAVAEAANGNATYIDLFTHRHPYVAGLKLPDQDVATVGAYHTADIPYWFDTLDNYNRLRPTRSWTAWDRTLSADMLHSLIAFADTGNPATPAMAWPAWTRANEVRVTLGDEAAVTKLDRTRLDWLAAHPMKPQQDTAPRRIRD